MTPDDIEAIAWNNADTSDLWLLDKLILSKKLEYVCGPTGMDVPYPNDYIIRPCVNILGLGLGTVTKYLTSNTDDLPLGFFWCEIFRGRHLSIDYHWGEQALAVEGFKRDDTYTQWDSWKRVSDQVPLPNIVAHLSNKYEWINCEFINGNLIEVHFRHNPDFVNNIEHFIPVWIGQSILPPTGYQYIAYPDIHGRIGAFTK